MPSKPRLQQAAQHLAWTSEGVTGNGVVRWQKLGNSFSASQRWLLGPERSPSVQLLFLAEGHFSSTAFQLWASQSLSRDEDCYNCCDLLANWSNPSPSLGKVATAGPLAQPAVGSSLGQLVKVLLYIRTDDEHEQEAEVGMYRN